MSSQAPDRQHPPMQPETALAANKETMSRYLGDRHLAYGSRAGWFQKRGDVKC